MAMSTSVPLQFTSSSHIGPLLWPYLAQQIGMENCLKFKDRDEPREVARRSGTYVGKPSMPQTTLASAALKKSPQTEPQVPLWKTSTRPLPLLDGLLLIMRRTGVALQTTLTSSL
jgi:hypothetical protein